MCYVTSIASKVNCWHTHKSDRIYTALMPPHVRVTAACMCVYVTVAGWWWRWCTGKPACADT